MSTRYRRAVTMLVLGVATLGHIASVRAREPESTSEDDGSEDATALIERAIALRRGGDDARALELFQQAEQLEPGSTRVLVHLAATHQALGHWEAADRYLTRALRNPDDPYIQRHQATLAAARRKVDSHIGTLEVAGGPRGTEVWLNGRLVGTLPIEQPVRIEAGIYTLEARLPGHYPVTRSLALASGTLARESIELTPLSSPTRLPAAPPEPDAAPPTARGATWLTWTFAGLALGAGGATVAAWVIRDRHVGNWNDDDECLAPGQTREELCHDERVDGERAETLMWIGLAATGALSAAAVGSLWITWGDERASEAAVGCGVGLGQLQCAGHF